MCFEVLFKFIVEEVMKENISTETIKEEDGEDQTEEPVEQPGWYCYFLLVATLFWLNLTTFLHWSDDQRDD